MKHIFITPLILAACISASSLQAAEAPKALDKQTSWGLYVDSTEAAAMKQKLGDKMLLVDVRDPVEIMWCGTPCMTSSEMHLRSLSGPPLGTMSFPLPLLRARAIPRYSCLGRTCRRGYTMTAMLPELPSFSHLQMTMV